MEEKGAETVKTRRKRKGKNKGKREKETRWGNDK